MHRNSDGDLHTHYTAPDEYGLEETSGQQHLESASPGQNAKQSATPSTDVSFEHLEMLLERLGLLFPLYFTQTHTLLLA